MHMLRSNRSSLVTAVAGVVSGLVFLQSAQGQQVPADTVVFQSGDDANSSTTSGLNTSTVWSGDNPASTTGVAFVDTQYRIRTPNGTGSGANVTVTADSFTLISLNPSPIFASTTDLGTGLGTLTPGSDGSYAYFTLKGGGNNTTTFNNLVLANGGVLFNYANNEQTIAGNIFLVPAGATSTSNSGINGDGITTTVSGGIIDTHGNNLSASSTTYLGDSYYNITSNISGGGMLRIENTGGGTIGSTFVPQVVNLSGSNTFTGGVVLDGTSTAGTTGVGPDLGIDSPNALGTGPLTVLPDSYVGALPAAGAPGLQIDNLSGAPLKLTTNNAQKWYGGFTFLGTSSLDMGSGPVSLNANVTLTTAASTLSLEGAISGAYGLTKAGSGTLLLNGKSTYTGGTTVTAGTLGGLGTVPGPLVVSSGASLAPGTAVLGELTDAGALNLSSGSILDIELASGTSDEMVSLTGGVTLTGSVLDITLAPGYTPSVGSVFTIIDNQSSLATTGTFSDVTGGYVTDALGDTYSVNYGAAVDGDSVANDVQLTFVSPVPEPTSLGLLGLAAVSMLGRRRRR